MSVQRRASKYHSRTVVPAELRPLVGRREVVKSLSTSSHKEACNRAAQWEGHVAALFDHLRHYSDAMNREQIDALVADYLDAALQDVDQRLATRLGTWVAPLQVNKFSQDCVRLDLDALKAALQYNDLSSTLPLAVEMLPPESSNATRKVLARRLLEAQYEAASAELKALNGEPLPRPVRSNVAPPIVSVPPEPASPLLSKMVADYATFKRAGRKWTDKTASQLLTVFRVMTEIIGDNPVREVTKDHMRELYRLMPQMPAHATKRYPGMVAEEAIAAADADGNDERFSPKTQNDYFTHIKSLWKWGVENDYIDKSPAIVLKDVDETAAWDQRPAFTDGQLKAYLGALTARVEDDPAMLWVPRLMLFAGMRTEEAAKLTPEDIRDEGGVTVIDINRRHGRLKTKNADRLVPVHSAILKELLHYASGRPKSSNLWDLRPNKHGVYSFALSKRLNTVLDNACPEDDRLVAYSLRHTFATRLKHADVQDSLLDELLGHKVEKLSTGRYGKRYPVDKLKEAVERLKVATGVY